MIFGKIEDLYLYKGLSENLAKGINFLLNFDTTQPDGKYEVDGENIYLLVSTGHTKPAEKPVYEAHRKYIDLQYIVKGEEDTGFVPLANCSNVVPYDEKSDCLFIKGDGSEVKVSAGEFYIAFPCDGHRPMCSKNPGEIRKVIVKIAV